MAFVAFPNTGKINPVTMTKTVAFTNAGTPTAWPASVKAYPSFSSSGGTKTTGVPIS